MRKGIKILGYIVSTLVLVTIILPLSLSVLINIGAVQNWVVDAAARFASRKLGTEVSIEHVDLGLFNRLQVEGFYVEDYQGDTLLYAHRVETGITAFKPLTFGVAKVDSALLRLAEMPDGEINIKQVVDRLRSGKGSNFSMAINRAEVTNFRFELFRNDTTHRYRGGIDWSAMQLYDADVVGRDFLLDGDSIALRLDKISLSERSGIRLDDVSADWLSIASGRMRFADLHLQSGATEINMPMLTIIGENGWDDYSDYINKVVMDITAENSHIDFATIGYFAPQIAHWRTQLSNVELRGRGTVADLGGRVEHVELGEGTTAVVDFRMQGLPEVERTRFTFDIERLATNIKDVSAVMNDLTGRTLPAKVQTMLARAEQINLAGEFDGRLKAFDAEAVLSTALGAIDGRMKMSEEPKSRQSRFVGDVATSNFDLGGLLAMGKLGRVSLDADLDGVMGGGQFVANIDGQVPLLDFNDYSYDSIALRGRIDNRRFEGVVGSDDHNLDFDFNGAVDFNGEVPRYDFALNLDRADLHALNFNRRDTVSVIGARLTANGSGNSLDNLNGAVRISNAEYVGLKDTIRTQSILLRGENSEGSKYVALNSDFADATFRSRLSYKTIFEYVKDGLLAYLPSLTHGEGHVHRHATDEVGSVDRYSLLSVNFKNTEKLTEAILSGLQIADGTSLSFMFNPDNDRFTLKLLSDYIERNNMMATKINLNANNSYDSLALYLRSEDLYLKQLHMPDLSVQAGAKNNRVSLSAGFNNAAQSVSALLGVDAVLGRNDDGSRRISIDLKPSNVRQGNQTWHIGANKIIYNPRNITVDHFLVRNDEQSLLLDGVASQQMADSVVLTLRNFDLSPFSKLLQTIGGYSIKGTSDGRAVMHSALKGGRIDGNVSLDGVEVNDVAVPPVQVLARWDMQRNRARLLLADRQKQDTVIRGYYAPDTKRYFIEAGIDNVPMRLIEPFLTGVISGTKGTADAKLQFMGKGREAELSGTIDVDSLRSRIDFTGVEYSIPSAKMEVKNNRFTLPATRFYDREGNSGTAEIKLDLNHLSNISFDIVARPNQMLVMDTNEKMSDLFYGTIYGTGSARIRGDKMGVKMDIAATTDDNSQFFLPLSGSSNISQADFVVFRSPRMRTDTTMTYLARKKLMYERRQRQRTSSGSDMDISMAVNVRPNAEFQLVIDPTVGDIIRGRGEGTLNMHINPRSGVFDMYGDCEITEGSYLFTLQNVVNKKFTIDAGSTIQWSGDPLDAMLNIRAIYQIKTSLQPLIGSTSASGSGGARSLVDCIINLTDRLSNPTVTFGIEVPNADTEVQNVVSNMLNTQEEIANQFIYLLVFNSFMNESGISGAANFGAVGTATTGFELLSNQLSNWLSTDDLSFIVRYRPSTEMSGDEFDLGFSKSLISDRLLVEVEGNYVSDRNTMSGQNSNLMGEAYITWLIDRAGNLKLKGFTQTIDRFDENQGLQESGIGIYYKEDFSTFRDIVRNFKERFANFGKRKRAKKAAREAESADTESDNAGQ